MLSRSTYALTEFKELPLLCRHILYPSSDTSTTGGQHINLLNLFAIKLNAILYKNVKINASTFAVYLSQEAGLGIKNEISSSNRLKELRVLYYSIIIIRHEAYVSATEYSWLAFVHNLISELTILRTKSIVAASLLLFILEQCEMAL